MQPLNHLYMAAAWGARLQRQRIVPSSPVTGTTDTIHTDVAATDRAATAPGRLRKSLASNAARRAIMPTNATEPCSLFYKRQIRRPLLPCKRLPTPTSNRFLICSTEPNLYIDRRLLLYHKMMLYNKMLPVHKHI